jgi:hypothetical protein
MRKATKIGVGVLLLMMPFAANLGTASASGSVTWTGNGSENLPCSDGGHWVLSPAQGITSATLTVDGTTYTMVKNGLFGSWAADSSGAITSSSTASATYAGNNTTAFLKLSSCVQGPPPPPPV